MAYEATVDEVKGALKFSANSIPASSTDADDLDEDDLERYINTAKSMLDTYAQGSAGEIPDDSEIGRAATLHYAVMRAYQKKGLDAGDHAEQWQEARDLVRRKLRDAGGHVSNDYRLTTNNTDGSDGRWTESGERDNEFW